MRSGKQHCLSEAEAVLEKGSAGPGHPKGTDLGALTGRPDWQIVRRREAGVLGGAQRGGWAQWEIQVKEVGQYPQYREGEASTSCPNLSDAEAVPTNGSTEQTVERMGKRLMDDE